VKCEHLFISIEKNKFTKPKFMKNYQKMEREDFIKFFRDADQLNKLTADDRVEIFATILTGSSDFTVELLNEILCDYSVGGIEVVNSLDLKE